MVGDLLDAIAFAIAGAERPGRAAPSLRTTLAVLGAGLLVGIVFGLAVPVLPLFPLFLLAGALIAAVVAAAALSLSGSDAPAMVGAACGAAFVEIVVHLTLRFMLALRDAGGLLPW